MSVYHLNTANEGEKNIPLITPWIMQDIPLPKQLMEKHYKSRSASEVFLPKRLVLFRLPLSSYIRSLHLFPTYALTAAGPPQLRKKNYKAQVWSTLRHGPGHHLLQFLSQSCAACMQRTTPALTLLWGVFVLNSDFIAISSREIESRNRALPLIHRPWSLTQLSLGKVSNKLYFNYIFTST